MGYLRLGYLTMLIFALGSCGKKSAPHVTAEEAILERQHQGLEGLVAAAQKGALIPFDQVLVIVNQRLVQDLLSAGLPYERVVSKKYRIRVTGATVLFDDGFALVRLDGRASLSSHPEDDVFAEVSVFGGLDIIELDPKSAILRGQVKIIAFETRQVSVLGIKAPADRLVDELGREKLDAFSSLASQIEIPVRLEREVKIPAVRSGGVQIAAAAIPLQMSIMDVKAFQGRLWICVNANAGRAQKETPPLKSSPSPTSSPSQNKKIGLS